MIDLWTTGRAEKNMAEEILVDLPGIVRRHPWWQARAGLTLALLKGLGVAPPARVLDAGCGWGVTLEALERQGYRAAGMDISRRALEILDRPDRRLLEGDLSQKIPDGIEPFDAVLALDVLEHLDDDRFAVEQLGRLVTRTGVVIVSVPALPELYTEFDLVQGHRRRYRVERLRAAFVDTGLEVERIFWWGSCLVPLFRWQRRRSKARAGESTTETYRRYLRLPPWPLSFLLRLALVIEQGRSLKKQRGRGTSLFAIARRKPRESNAIGP
ncbi:MAG: class I SAM-dependent methyltransferase [Isosphaeraceae bacterium]